MSEKQETVKEACAEMELVSGDETVDEIVVKKEDWIALANRILSAHNREIAEKDAEIAWLKRGIDQMDTNCNRLKERIALLEKALKSSCRWIKCHDIYHTSGVDILKEAKELLQDDGEFLFKENK